MDLTGLGFLIAGSKEAESVINFEGIYNIYIYDTQAKEIIYKDAVTLNSTDTFIGSYLLYKESQSAVSVYYAKLICNEVLKKYDKINQWLDTKS